MGIGIIWNKFDGIRKPYDGDRVDPVIRFSFYRSLHAIVPSILSA